MKRSILFAAACLIAVPALAQTRVQFQDEKPNQPVPLHRDTGITLPIPSQAPAQPVQQQVPPVTDQRSILVRIPPEERVEAPLYPVDRPGWVCR